MNALLKNSRIVWNGYSFFHLLIRGKSPLWWFMMSNKMYDTWSYAQMVLLELN